MRAWWIEPGAQAVLVPSPERTPPAGLVVSQPWEPLGPWPTPEPMTSLVSEERESNSVEARADQP